MKDSIFFVANTEKFYKRSHIFIQVYELCTGHNEWNTAVSDWCIYVSIVPSFTMAMARLRARASRRSSVFVDSISSSWNTEEKTT